MKEIYFAKEDSSFFKRVSKNLIFYGSDTMVRGFPGWTTQLAEKVLCSPTPSRNYSVPDGFEENLLNVAGHRIRVYSKGTSKKAVVFSHGWSGNAGNFSSFFDHFLNEGYRVVVFDHVAHGRSEGIHANLFLFMQSVRAVLNWVESQEEIAGIVAHSMGGSAVISALQEHQKQIPLALIAPVVPIFESLQESIDNFGISQKWLDVLFTHFEQRYAMKIHDIDPKKRIKSLANPVLILQDRKDSYIPLEMNMQYIPENLKSSLVVTENLGHFRILKSAKVTRQALEFIDGARNKG